jgi:hypothetical protein
MICPKCGFENRKEANFCKECGAKLELFCPSCGHPYEPSSKFCDKCGYDLRLPKDAGRTDYSQPQSYTPKHLADKILNTRSTLEGERKLVTVMFADVAGFTAISEKQDPEDVHRIMDGCCRILVDEIHKFEERSASSGATASWPFSGLLLPMKTTPSGPVMQPWPSSRP